jgi:hypothetical protein
LHPLLLQLVASRREVNRAVRQLSQSGPLLS